MQESIKTDLSHESAYFCNNGAYHGADLYTTSQLLGHADVETTQVYAKIIDAKKEAAVLLIDSLF